MPNRLAAERSPYLLQHAHNPVDWYAWGAEAFAKARDEDKPIFLSIGYSTCHWCHVMEHESFESAEIAEVLNCHFVSIKVDREERPDIDRVYMTFVQATTGAGGWPMSVWLTPDLKPFYGGTYFPPSSRWGRRGFKEVLTEIARTWREDRGNVARSADSITERLRTLRAAGLGAGPVAGPDALAEGVAQYRASFDARNGGFGDAPKFPRPTELLFLLREHARAGDADARAMVLATLRGMARGGMRDHVGGGFHRYSVDGGWRVPHFEKMLYDQAQLVLAYVEAAQVAGDRQYLDVAEDTLAYVSRDMVDAAGGFYSAEDADSVPPEHAGDPTAHKTEGAFYLWREAELERLLGGDVDVARFRFGTDPRGNAPADPQGEFGNGNILYLAREIDEVARLTGRTVDDVQAALPKIRATLFEARSKRPRPHLDDKILTAWNGLMIAAYARAARVGRSQEHLATARRAARFLRTTMWEATRGVLLRRYRDGSAGIEAYAEDYAFLVWGLLELFQADGDPEWLAWALELQARQDDLFWDPVEGGWFSTTGTDPSVLLRMKEDYDGAEPSATSAATLNLLTLAHLSGDEGRRARAEQALGRLGARLGQSARVVPLMMCALSAYHADSQQIVVVGRRGADDTERLWRVIGSHYLPFAVAIPIEPGAPQEALGARLPFVGPMTMREGRATAYVCRDFTCREPVTDPEALDALLR